MRLRSLPWLAPLLVLLACDPPPPPAVDAGPEDAGVDAPSCADFSGAYRTENLLDPCFESSPIQIGSFCIAQDGCAVTVSGTHGELTGTAGEAEVSFEAGFLRCTARREGERLLMDCEDTDFMTTCSTSADAAPPLDNVCCTSDAECGEGDRCAPVTLPPSSAVLVASACVPAGAGELGGTCVTTDGLGDCGAGLTCTGGGLGDDAIECRPICRAAGDCAGGQACVWYPVTAPTVGFCADTCTVRGDECGGGATCDGVTTLAADGSLTDGLTCRSVGTVDSRDACARDTDCGPDHLCARPPSGGDMRCHPICGPDDPCEDGADRCVFIGVSDTPPAGACIPR